MENARDWQGRTPLKMRGISPLLRAETDQLPVFREETGRLHRPKTHTDAANAIIEEIRSHDRSRIAAGDESAGRDVHMLPATALT